MSESVNHSDRTNSILEELAREAPLLVETLACHWSTGQGTRVRHILWSLYTCSHLVNLGSVCSGLDERLSRALATAITARLMQGAEVEPLILEILRKSGEFDRFDNVERATPDHLPVVYPSAATDSKSLRRMADAMDRLAKRRGN